MVSAILIVHAESSVYMAQVVIVIQLTEGPVGQLCFAMEALEQVVICRWTCRKQPLDGTQRICLLL